MEKIRMWEVAPQDPESNCIRRALGLKKGTTALFRKGARQRKKAEELLCGGNHMQMLAQVIPSWGDVFGCLGSNPSARFDMDGVAMICDGLPRPVGTRIWWHPGGTTWGTKTSRRQSLFFSRNENTAFPRSVPLFCSVHMQTPKACFYRGRLGISDRKALPLKAQQSLNSELGYICVN